MAEINDLYREIEAAGPTAEELTEAKDYFQKLEAFGPAHDEISAMHKGLFLLKSIALQLKTKERRKQFCNNYSWAIPKLKVVQRVVEILRKHSATDIIEVGAGTGLWAHLLTTEGCTVRAIDDDSWKLEKRYHPIEKLGHVEALRKYTNHTTLFLSWPPQHSIMAYEALQAFTGKYLVYLGEPADGSTACPEFFNALSKKKLLHRILLPQWPGIVDTVYIYAL